MSASCSGTAEAAAVHRAAAKRRGRPHLAHFHAPPAAMQSRDFYVSSAASALMRGASAAPRSAVPLTFTSRVASRAPAFMPASVREARLYVPAAKEEKSWMEGFLKDLAAVRGWRRGPRYARRGSGHGPEAAKSNGQPAAYRAPPCAAARRRAAAVTAATRHRGARRALGPQAAQQAAAASQHPNCRPLLALGGTAAGAPAPADRRARATLPQQRLTPARAARRAACPARWPRRSPPRLSA